jgi:hypothetical protein
MKSKANVFLFGTIVLILLAVVLVAVLNRSSPTSSPADVRARAGAKSTLKLIGVVNSVNEAKGTIGVTGVHFADSNRAGAPQDFGDWTVTAPAAFNFASISPGSTVTIGIDANTFNIASRAVTAVTLTSGN